ncbi:hypothetical protein AVEN_242389-1 [Araneus ventricosus]|uniref:Uncharacterized protein n=1 Tax=Araneus ventricosus TaxID=182803 RepID=A0A4Y2NIU8_ARAVE|nr:hypothetical protein AVEN_54200-1 [Araneus ventricosus]GBN39486.1 hypothetical protein AVEN_273569-1 [Araneus ventricosus]GBN39816.1 hypothetical protein AVEN_222940-1 [Araneus ventricosus]GBN39827.1 hypothetical protein AVEN_242389-1 [Araneus ventricosus]
MTGFGVEGSSMSSFKLDIHDKALLHHLDQRQVWCHPINTIHLGGSFTSDPKALPVVSTPTFKTGPLLFPPDFPRLTLTTFLLTHDLFSLFGESILRSQGSYFTNMAAWKTKDVGFPNFL